MRSFYETSARLRAVVSRNPWVAAFAVGGVVLLLSLYLLLRPTPAVAPLPDTATTTASTTALVLPEAQPVTLRIPAIEVNASFEAPLRRQENGEIEVPEAYDTVAYYEYGPTPGELGPAVVLGHVDSYEGPAVLFRLGQLEPGDEILIEREDGTVATFAVTKLERHDQAEFPTREVYGDIDHAGLRLITCTGVYDHGSLRYSHNLIVFAELMATSTSAAGE